MKETGRGFTIDGDRFFVDPVTFIGFKYYGQEGLLRKFYKLYRRHLTQQKARDICEYMGRDYPRKYSKTFLFKKNTLRSKGGRK